MTLSTICCIAGGYAGAELTDIITDSEAAMATSSTIAQFATFYGSFLPLHARSNNDLYYEKEHFQWRTFGRDMITLFGTLLPLDIAYLIARPLAHYHFQTTGHEPGTASLLADTICIPAYILLAHPIAYFLGVIRTNDDSRNTPNTPPKSF